MTLKSGYRLFKVIENGTNRKLGYGFLFAFRSNHGRVFSRFDTIHERDGHQTPHDGIVRAYEQHRVAKSADRFTQSSFIYPLREIPYPQIKSIVHTTSENQLKTVKNNSVYF